MARRRTAVQVRRALAAVALGAVVAGTAACSPVATQLEYAPSDGARVVLGEEGELTIENLLVLTEEADAPALVVAGVTNRTDEPMSVTLTFAEGVATTLEVPANGTVLLDPANPDGETVILEASPVPPGATLPVTVSTPELGATLAEVAVLDGTLAPYDTYLEEYVEDAGAAG